MLKTFTCALFAFLLLIPLMEDISKSKKSCSCTKNFFMPNKKWEKKWAFSYTKCDGGMKFRIIDGKTNRSAPEPCKPGVFERLDRLDFGMKCFDDKDCMDLAIGSAQFVGAFFSFGIGYPSLAMLIVFSSYFGFSGEPGKETFGLKS